MTAAEHLAVYAVPAHARAHLDAEHKLVLREMGLRPATVLLPAETHRGLHHPHSHLPTEEPA